jgi:subtilisin family serine protease
MILSLRLPKFWTCSTKVCVIDSGIDYNHPDLAGNMPDKLIWDAINDRPGGPENDDNGHGTHVAGAAYSTLLVIP